MFQPALVYDLRAKQLAPQGMHWTKEVVPEHQYA